MSAELMPARLYEIRVETLMPNLEENLRYATTRESRCMSQHDLPRAFPMLAHAALKGCGLRNEQSHGTTIVYDLVCSGRADTTGSARFVIEPGKISGLLNVRLGGKNMTFTQRLSGSAVGSCPNEME